MGTYYYIGDVALKTGTTEKVSANIERLELPFEVLYIAEGPMEGTMCLHQTDGSMSYGDAEEVDKLLDALAKNDEIEPSVQFVEWESEEYPLSGWHVLVAGQGIVNSNASNEIREVEVDADTPAGEIVVPVRAYCDGRGKALIIGGACP